MSAESSPAPEARALADLSGEPTMIEVRRSLAVGAVVRGRLTFTEAALAAQLDEAELRPAVDAGSSEPVEVSVVVPAFNEADGLHALWSRLSPVLDEIGSAELIVVDDGSSDATWDEIRELAGRDRRVHGLRLSRNFGHQAALSAGMAAARGRAVCFLDADLQDPPELLLTFVERWHEGNEVVYAVRRTRKEGLFKRTAYRAFYRLYARLADIEVPLDSGDFALMDRVVVEEILRLPEHNRFLRGLRSWVGHRQTAVEYDRDARFVGSSKYSFGKMARLALDGLVSFSSAPLRLASVLGFLTALAGAVYIGVAIVARLFLGGVPEGWTSLIAVILTVGGMQLLVTGVLGEYLARVYDEAKARPNYVIAARTPPHT